MIWPFSLYSELARLQAREAVLASECATLRADIELLRTDRDGLLDRLLIAAGSWSMGESRPAAPAPDKRPETSATPMARNMRDYQRLAELALSLPTTQLPERGN